MEQIKEFIHAWFSRQIFNVGIGIGGVGSGSSFRFIYDIRVSFFGSFGYSTLTFLFRQESITLIAVTVSLLSTPLRLQ